jgi:hypothetical protein
MNKILILLSAISLFYACKMMPNQTKRYQGIPLDLMDKRVAKDPKSHISTNPKDSLAILRLEQEARFLVYAVNCEDSITCGNSITSETTVGQANLKIFDITQDHDSISFYYTIWCSDTIQSYKRLPKTGLLFVNGKVDAFTDGSWEMQFPIKNKKTKERLSIAELEKSAKINPNSSAKSFLRLLLPLQPEVLIYLKQHKTNGNSWFLEEAQRRGAFK